MTIVKAKNTETQISDTQNLENENQLNSEAIQTNYYKYIKSKFNDFFFLIHKSDKTQRAYCTVPT